MNIKKYLEKPKCCYDSGGTSSIIKIFSNNLFEYNPPNGLTKYQVENALHSGVAALYKLQYPDSVNNGKWCCTPAKPASILDNNGVPKVITTHGTDYSVDLDVDRDCILLYNNSMKMGDDLIEKYASLIDDIDLTILTVIKWCRVMPIPKVINDADIAKYELVMQRVLDGELINVVNDKSSLMRKDTANPDNKVELTQPNAAEKLHFLSEFREETIKRLSTLFGIPLSTSAKSVQTLNAELHGMDFYSLFCLFDRYEARKESFERAKEFTGHDWNFDFSYLMKHQIDDIINHRIKDVPRETNKEGSDENSEN